MKLFLKFFSSELFSKLSVLLALTVISRAVSMEEFGVISFIQVVYMYGTLLIDQGMNQVLIRELGKKKSIAPSFLKSIIGRKFAVAVPFVVLVTVLVSWFDPENVKIYSIYMAALLIYPLNLSWLLIGRGKALLSSVVNIIQSLTFLLGIIIFFKLTVMPISYFALSYLISYGMLGIIYLSVLVLISRKKEQIEVRIDPAELKSDIRYNFISIILTQIYVSSDQILLYLLGDSSAVGMYNASYRIVNLITSVISIGSIFFLPIFSKFSMDDRREEKTIDSFLSLAIVLCSFIAVGGIGNSKIILNTMFGSKFAEGSTILAILLSVTVVIIWNVVFGTILQAYGFQKQILYISAITAASNLILNIVFILLWGAIGAAVTTLIAEIVVFISYLYIISKMIKLKLMISYIRMILVLSTLILAQLLIYKIQLSFVGLVALYAVLFVLVCASLKKYKFMSLYKETNVSGAEQ